MRWEGGERGVTRRGGAARVRPERAVRRGAGVESGVMRWEEGVRAAMRCERAQAVMTLSASLSAPRTWDLTGPTRCHSHPPKSRAEHYLEEVRVWQQRQ